MMDGYIKLHRKVLESAVFCNAHLWQVFCWALLRANHRPRSIMFGGEQTYLKAGQFISGRFAGAGECNLSPSTFRNQVDKLERLGILSLKSDNKKTLFTVVKWGQYQIQGSAEDNKRTTDGQQMDTDKNVRMKEQDGSFDPNDAFDSIWKEYPRRLKKKDAFKHFRASVKTQADVDRIRKALANYKAKILRDKTEERYIQHGSTWFNDWESWENVEPAKPRTASALAQFGTPRP